ncbi:MAG: baseplate J/gp47 family protein [Blastocatellia bacterium]
MTADLIPAPDLEIRDEEQFAAEVIGRTSGGLTVDRVRSQIEERRRLLTLLEGGAFTDPPICQELINANPSAPHTVQLEAQAWMLAQMGYRINQIPKQNEIAFANLFRIGLREAEPATTILEFTVAPPSGVDVTIPLGTQVSTTDGGIVFETTEQFVVEFPAPTGLIAARNVVAGSLLLAPDQLVKMVDALAWVDFVTNPDAIDGGGDDEAVEEALERARSYQRRGERLVSTLDFEEAILHDALRDNGIVRGFPFVVLGDFDGPRRPGHSTFVVMTRNGNPISDDDRQALNSILEQRVGNQFIYVSDPIYINFNITATVKLTNASPQAADATKGAIEANLRAFYAADRENFGRPIVRSEIITVIEGTRNVDRIISDPNGPILASPLEDVRLDPWQLPKLNAVTLTSV